MPTTKKLPITILCAVLIIICCALNNGCGDVVDDDDDDDDVLLPPDNKQELILREVNLPKGCPVDIKLTITQADAKDEIDLEPLVLETERSLTKFEILGVEIDFGPSFDFDKTLFIQIKALRPEGKCDNFGIADVCQFNDVPTFEGLKGDERQYSVSLEEFKDVAGSPCLIRPILTVTGTTDSKEFTRYQLSVENWSAFPDELFAAAPDLPPCGLNESASRTWVDIFDEKGNRLFGFCALGASESLTKIWFSVPRGEDPPPFVFITLADRRDGVTYTSNMVEIK